MNEYDIIIVGAGIIGLTITKELTNKYPSASILILDKETSPALHGSGRNSGVLHSGIYYAEDSLKAKCCAEGAQLMASYCNDNKLPIKHIGKVIVPTKVSDNDVLELLYKRGKANGAKVTIIDDKKLKEIEPEAKTATGYALYSPNTAVVDPIAIINCLVNELKQKGVVFSFGETVKSADVEQSLIRTPGSVFKYKMLVNAAGQQADRVARLFGASKDFTLLPFKGLYYALSGKSKLRFNGLIYPVPDMNVPFLGVHSVKNVAGDVYFGPTALPAFGREHYSGLKGIEVVDTASIGYHLMQQYTRNKQGFRQFAHEEAGRFFKHRFIAAAKALVPNLRDEDLITSKKVGIRAQLLNKNSHELVMDFLTEKKGNTFHVLNAVSPAFTSSLSFAKLIVSDI